PPPPAPLCPYTALFRSGDRGQSAFVPGQQVPVRVGGGGIATPWTEQTQSVTGPCCRGPRSGQTLVPVVDEVQGQQAVDPVPGTYGVGPCDRPLRTRAFGQDRIQVVGVGVGLGGRGKQQLDVAVRVSAGVEGRQALTAQNDPDHARGQALDRLDPSCVDGSFFLLLRLRHEVLPLHM